MSPPSLPVRPPHRSWPDPDPRLCVGAATPPSSPTCGRASTTASPSPRPSTPPSDAWPTTWSPGGATSSAPAHPARWMGRPGRGWMPHSDPKLNCSRCVLEADPPPLRRQALSPAPMRLLGLPVRTAAGGTPRRCAQKKQSTIGPPVNHKHRLRPSAGHLHTVEGDQASICLAARVSACMPCSFGPLHSSRSGGSDDRAA
jgi:hypothetical protein